MGIIKISEDIKGRGAILQRMIARINTSTTEPLGISQQDGKTIMTAKVPGNFPNSPATLKYAFGLAGNKIMPLEIR